NWDGRLQGLVTSMLTVMGRLLKVQSRNLPAARNFSSGLRAIFMQSTPDPYAAPDVKGGPLAPFEYGWQTFDVPRHRASQSRRDSLPAHPATRKMPCQLSHVRCATGPGGAGRRPSMAPAALWP